MKTPKLLTASIAILLLSSFLFGENPSAALTKKLGNNLLNHLSEDIVLTDSQKIVIQSKANEFEVKLQNLSNKSDLETRNALKKEAVLKYSVVFDSILTEEQRDTLKTKQIERMVTEINSYNTKNKK